MVTKGVAEALSIGNIDLQGPCSLPAVQPVEGFNGRLGLLHSPASHSDTDLIVGLLKQVLGDQKTCVSIPAENQSISLGLL
jgi:hypothetical protein